MVGSAVEAPMLESFFRPLTPAEQRLLRARIRDLQSRLQRGPKALLVAPGISSILWVLTLALSDSPWLIVTAFWILLGSGITLWVRRDLRKDLGYLAEMRRGYESAYARNEAEVFPIRARSFVEFEEVEDEGACYAFEIEDDRLVFVVGQEFYPKAEFPSHDFSFVHIVDEEGRVVDTHIEKRGARAAAARTIPAATKLELEIPEHLEVLDGGPGEIEDLLSRPRSRR